MNNVLIYTRTKQNEPIAEQTAAVLCEQLQLVGMHVETSHALNIPRLVLNSYQTIHLIVENLPLSVNEIFHLALCKALGKSTVLSVLNSERKINKSLLELVKPDALSVSQTNHLKLYRSITCNKFILSGFPKTDTFNKKTVFRHQAYLIPLQTGFEEVLQYNISDTVYFDGRKLLKKNTSSQLRKKWNELISSKKIDGQFHLVLSDAKLLQLIADESLSIVLANPSLQHAEFVAWLNICLNKNNLILLNEFQATGFSNYWTSGHNCQVLNLADWMKQIGITEARPDVVCSNFKTSELLEPTVNELSRLYSKLWHQKTSLLTSGSVKL